MKRGKAAALLCVFLLAAAFRIPAAADAAGICRQAAGALRRAVQQAAEIRDRARERTRASKYPDVAGRWYAAAVNALTELGAVAGGDDGLFHPEKPVSRAQLLKMMAVLSGKDLTAREERNSFSDVAQDAWYAPYVRWAVREKLLTGREGDSLEPDGSVTRQEMAVLLYRFNKNVMGKRFPDGETPGFADDSSISGWAALEVSAVGRAGLMTSYQDGTFRPLRSVTRGEAAQILYRYLQEEPAYANGCPIDDFRYVTHAGGLVEGSYTYTNSLEALDETYNWGNRVVELDFSWTSDGELVCLHNWGGSHAPYGTLEEFLNTPVYGKFTPMGLKELSGLLKSHPDASVIMDFKSDTVKGLEKIAKECPGLQDQFFPYVNGQEEYEEVSALGYRNIVLFLARVADKDYSALAEFARERELVGIAANAYVDSGIFAPARQAGVPVMSYTVDDEQLMYKLSLQGSDGFITNLQNALIIW